MPKGVLTVDEMTFEKAMRFATAFAGRPEGSSRLIRLEDELAYPVLCAAALLGRFKKLRGFEKQRLLAGLVKAGVRNEEDLRAWIGNIYSRVHKNKWDSSRKRADEFLSAGIRVMAPEASCGGAVGRPLPPADLPECPGILFAKGCPSAPPPLLAVFNSRKPRLVSPLSSWLEGLRSSLGALEHGKIALAGSTGTLTYDLASVFAHRFGFLQLLVAPFPLTETEPHFHRLFGEKAADIPVISCALCGAPCPAKLPLKCRDRLLAWLSDLHLVLEIRSGGNLLAVLEELQTRSPRPRLVMKPEGTGSGNGGNRILLRKFPKHTVGFNPPGQHQPARSKSFAPANFSPSSGLHVTRINEVALRDYLFHYTRACGGPWPGQTYRQYLLELLEPDGLPGRSAFDTLLRIAAEGLLRAHCRMVRGRTAVVCWSSLHPKELSLIRKWRPGLARWTVEPYGVALRRDLLRSLGAKPAIYGSAQSYSKLPESERFRFQLSGRGSSAGWRHEREWRSAGDLALGDIRPGQGFYFVRSAGEAERFYDRVEPGLPVLAINGHNF